MDIIWPNDLLILELEGLMSQAYHEHLCDIAAEAYELSARLCGPCRDLHALWPYIRLSRSSTGVEDEGSKLERELRKLITGGLRNVLIAGSADTGLLALVARAAAGQAGNIVVLDICETPLELCRRFARQWAMPIETRRQDLREMDIQQQFDLVLVHGTLHFIAADGRLNALTRIRHAMRPRSRLMLLFNTSEAPTVELAEKFHTDYADAVLYELKRLQISLPDTRASIRARLLSHSRRRQLREGAFAQSSDAKILLENAGFDVISCSQVDVKLALLATNLASRISKRRFRAIAAPNSAIAHG
jgi:Methyltransferase domain